MRITQFISGSAVDRVSEALLLVGTDGQVLDANQAALACYGYTRREMLGLTAADIHAVSHGHEAELCSRSAPDAPSPRETEHRRKDGSCFPVEVRSTRVQAHGEDAMLCGVRDVSDRQLAERAATLAEAIHTTAFRVSPDAMIITRAEDGGFIEVNEAFTDLTGYAWKDVQGATAVERRIWAHPSDRTLLVQGLHALGIVRDFETQIRRKDGHVFDCSLSAQLIDVNGETCILSDFSNVSDRNALESALREAETSLNTAEHLAGVGSWAWDIKSNHTECSREMLGLFSMERGPSTGSLVEIIGQRVHPDDRAKVEMATASVGSGGTPSPLEFRIISPDGSTHVMQAEVGGLFLDDDGNPARLTGTIRDITEETRAAAYKDMQHEIMAILNRPGDLRSSLQCVVEVLKECVGVDAVGVRLKDEDDYPYFAAAGFSTDFLKTESSLLLPPNLRCSPAATEEAAMLPCTCGLVLSGQAAAERSLLTPGGSFWSNSASQLLELPAEQDPRHLPRNTCMHFGYESMALVPIRDKDAVVGLMHLSDRCRDRFTLSRVEQLEDIAAHIGEALMRKKIEEDLAQHAEQLSELAEARERDLEKLVASLSSIIALVCEIMETRDPYTAGHGRRVAELAVAIAERLELTEEQVEDIRVAALIHDVGKVSVPAEILAKPGRLRDYEYALIKLHSDVGRRILAAANIEPKITEMVFQHHERCDGSGYPRGLHSADLLVGSRILAVADVVEAMVSDRPYRQGLGVEAALAEIEQGSGQGYDPLVSAACLSIFRDGGFSFIAQEAGSGRLE